MFRSIVLTPLAAFLVLPLLINATPKPSKLHLHNKRCSPWYDEEFFHGFLPPVACWQDQDTGCNPYIREGTEMLLDAEHGLAVIYGISTYCAELIAEELARTADGRRTYGWVEKHGNLTVIGDILVISSMSQEAVETYQGLVYFKDVVGPIGS